MFEKKRLKIIDRIVIKKYSTPRMRSLIKCKSTAISEQRKN
jgi:hypothetical protein